MGSQQHPTDTHFPVKNEEADILRDTGGNSCISVKVSQEKAIPKRQCQTCLGNIWETKQGAYCYHIRVPDAYDIHLSSDKIGYKL